MRIQSIEVKNFKSLVDFKLNLAKFSCLVGLNGSGKSTVLQFIDFLGQQARGDVKDWLEERHWTSDEVMSRFASMTRVTFKINVIDDRGQEITWKGTFDPVRLLCTRESIKSHNAQLEVVGRTYLIKEEKRTNGRTSPKPERIPFTYEGSILSQLREDILPKSIQSFKEFLLGIESLDMLTPERLRQRTRNADGSLGHGGRNLSAFVFELGAAGRKELAKRLKQAYKQFHYVTSKSLRSGWKQLYVAEKFGDSKIWTEARHVNDGTLRLLAILAEVASDHAFILFDEIENGINPELVEFVIDNLVEARQQVLVTTHSPMILNYLDDEVARRGVIYLYKTAQGHTKSIPFFSIPSLAEKLTVMGPGEAFVDTNLTELAAEIATMREER